ncbi:hypothetical protein [Paenibacillus oceani]|uniref:Rho termination factor N-terminal domain-containing protein n=1 Tax=Paenibacillus oceani TaxID=2772510 RepID=A0A927GZM0_9BACL|nr:hypothetical protein [Paenibacillus oceani]MBD2861604.1 hypothetical protein [Paenibacillus oceani]
MITLKRLNVVKKVESEFRAEALIRQGFELVEEQEPKKDQQVSEEMLELRERAAQLGIPRASQMGEKKLLEAIAEKELELQKGGE